ncbi:MAG: arylsulfatase [Fuerstiella sp.]|nr:arylsulfatase [Fuerstiella sp.]
MTDVQRTKATNEYMNRCLTAAIVVTLTQLLPTATSAAQPQSGGAENASPARTSPNIVVILADDMNWHHPGFNGGPVSTPNLDRLALEGTRLTQFYVHSVCSPTRAAFLTGRYPFRNGMEERSHGNDVAGMLTDERTLAEAFKEAGYVTAIIGKWHLGNWYQHHLPMQRGFDYQYGLYGALISYYDKVRDHYYDWHRNEQTIREDGYSTDLIASECGRVIAAHDARQPFFLYVPINAVHGPNEAPPELTKKYQAMVEKQPGRLSPSKKSFLALKYAMLESMDVAIGNILNDLEARGVLDDTLIVFFNDNGGRIENPPYRGGKGDTFEGGVRVPCIFRWPGKVPANRSVDGMMHVVDLFPTLLSQGNGSLKQDLPLDGMDMWGVISGDNESPRTEVVHSLPGEHSDTGEMSIRQGRFKLVGKALFDIEGDSAETDDIAAEYPLIYQSLRERLNRLESERRTPEVHTNITSTIETPLLVFGKEENANPPSWLVPYLKALPPSAKELLRAKRRSQGK